MPLQVFFFCKTKSGTDALSCCKLPASTDLGVSVLYVLFVFPRLDSMKDEHKANRQQHEKHLQSRVDSTRAIGRLEGSAGGIGERYKFLQEMRGYVQDLLECFSEKVRMQKY